MARRKKQTDELTPLELQILHALWQHGPQTVQQVQGMLPHENALAYTTVQTMLNILHRKGRARRRLRGRAFVYEAAVSHDAVAGEAIRDLLSRLFGGSPERLLMSMVKSNQMDPEKLTELGRRLQNDEPGHEEPEHEKPEGDQ